MHCLNAPYGAPRFLTDAGLEPDRQRHPVLIHLMVLRAF